MSLYGMMRTGVSGMNAQANRLSAVADNIANASTIGYKRAETQFSSLVLPSSGGQYNSGSVLTSVRYGISDQGGIRSTSSTTDLAIDGNGYFLVQGADGATVRLQQSATRERRVRRAREIEVRAGLHKGATSAYIERGRGEERAPGTEGETTGS